ncbi:hypothetical protein [Streptomyces sp. ST2-7A]|uniref:hypothetical protein n=1 Tax=Streptomyces sp. ST2-7A TaxID=2907214 RepID=UPI001F1E5BF7|nr:hypothetical protein [Streptomyces sp. ST2-7A]MCE7081864.1 hypothetical protein [Streptomyces sp. ST2-7A]
MRENRDDFPPREVIRFRARKTGEHPVISNEFIDRLRYGTSLGMAAYILTLPEGEPVTFDSLAERYPDDRFYLKDALRELEGIGFLERFPEN